MRLLVVRNDKLGDFMLAWPLFALLKQQWPELHISALVPAYTAPMARLCPWIDELIIDHPENGILSLRRELKRAGFDAMLTLFSTGRVALAGCLAGIPYRLAPATKLAQFCYNHRLVQRRSRSEKPEYAYNLDLGYRLLHDLKGLPLQSTTGSDDFLPPTIQRPLLRLNSDETAQRREAFFARWEIPPRSRLLFLHPGSGGSANNLSPEQYAMLANSLRSASPVCIVVTAGPGEEEVARRVAANITTHPTVLLPAQGDLSELPCTLALADLFISNSTGPLHVAAALDRPTATFYPRHRSATPLRWQPLNAPHKRLAFVPPAGARADDVAAIDVAAAALQISETFLR